MNNDIHSAVSLDDSTDSTFLSSKDEYPLTQAEMAKAMGIRGEAYDTDSEYRPVLDKPTEPLLVTMLVDDKVHLYLHPEAPLTPEQRKDPTFKAPFAYIDAKCWEWEWRDEKPNNTKTLTDFFYWACKDLEFQFAVKADYVESVLNHLKRIRRYYSEKPLQIRSNKRYLCVKVPDPKSGRLRWMGLSLLIKDISAMQGAVSLPVFSKNVGRDMGETKEIFSSQEKADMIQRYIDRHLDTTTYSKGDNELVKLAFLTHQNMQELREACGLPHSEKVRYTTGCAVADFLETFLCQQLGVTSEQFYTINRNSGSEAITSLSKMLRKKALIWLGMNDGGRAVAERDMRNFQPVPPSIFKNRKVKGVYQGVLVDIDISGCYGNGLCNQKYYVGIPTVFDTAMSLEEFEKVIKKSEPGAWTCRISWTGATFKQDVLLSKVPEAFTSWDWGWVGDRDGLLCEDGKRVYDASMALFTNSVLQAAMNHDLYQIIMKVASNEEKTWLRKNAVVESAAVYLKKNERSEVTPEMLEGIATGTKDGVIVKGSHHWVAVPLKCLVSKLLTIRKEQQDAGLEDKQTFTKLVINTIYGVIASEAFSVPGLCVANIVVGSNITARARALAWLMAKGLHTFQSITDGGSFDLNKVVKLKSRSLNLLEGLHRHEYTDSTRHKFATLIPLLDREVTAEEFEVDSDKNSPLMKEVNKASWKHLQKQFKGIDLLNQDQFSFSAKRVALGWTPHSKVDYRFSQVIAGEDMGETYTAYRGLPKVRKDVKKIDPDTGREYWKVKRVINPIADIIFDAVENCESVRLQLNDVEILSLSDWEKSHKGKTELTPGDIVSSVKTFHSHTPLARRFKDLAEYKEVNDAYQEAKKDGGVDLMFELYQK